MSQVIFASCTASEGTLFRPEWGQFPRPQVEHPPPRSAKPLKEPALAPGDFHSSPGGPSFIENPPVLPADLKTEATCRPGAAPPITASEHPPSLPSPEGSGRPGGPLRRSSLNRPKPARNSPARHRPPPLFQDRNPGAGSATRDRRRLGANLRLPLGTRKILRLSQARATKKFTKKLGLFLVDFGCKILSAIATSLMVPQPQFIHILSTNSSNRPKNTSRAVFSPASA